MSSIRHSHCWDSDVAAVGRFGVRGSSVMKIEAPWTRSFDALLVVQNRAAADISLPPLLSGTRGRQFIRSGSATDATEALTSFGRI